ncbi:MAG: guanylate kinase [Lentisphaerae bacterium]|nr:guanylate kinase [Lentisphaerota bacterium]
MSNEQARETAPGGRALLIVVSAPSGAGKTTLLDRLLAEHPSFTYSVSCTTRPPRGNERDGVAYRFLDEDTFRRLVEEGEFLEYARVHGHLYGTRRRTVEEALAQRITVVMDIDVQGAEQVRRRVGQAPADDPIRRAFVDIFIEPPSREVLRRRLENRGEDSPAEIRKRLNNAQAEMTHRHAYRYRIVNDELERAYGELKAVVARERRIDSAIAEA